MYGVPTLEITTSQLHVERPQYVQGRISLLIDLSGIPEVLRWRYQKRGGNTPKEGPTGLFLVLLVEWSHTVNECARAGTTSEHVEG